MMAKLNARFAKPPREAQDAHRPWTGGLAILDEAMARREERTLSKALDCSTAGHVHCVKTSGPGIALRGAKVTLLHFMDGSMSVRHKDRVLETTLFKRRPGPGPPEDEKTIDLRMTAIIAATRTTAQTASPQGCGQRAG